MKKSFVIWAFVAGAVAAFGEGATSAALERINEFLKDNPGNSKAYQARGEEYFRLGNFKASVADFNRVIAANPASEPHHWQRGISFFYAGQFQEGVDQFEKHRAVNGNDVENSVWHYLCLAKAKGHEEAKKQFIPTGGDSRVPMMEVHGLFAGKLTPEDVLAAAKKENSTRAYFYAHLYLGLYYHILDRPDEEKMHIQLAVTDYSLPGYMGDVARSHARLLGVQARQ
ncbi:MAG: hypothetical protein K9M45_00505 [Kiritimatiellales bacterium]|nr:hypothetical protein [Kiritimatiellales bacterium]